jgi:hypothetical protein
MKVQERDAIEWTPNTIASEVKIQGNKLAIELVSDTPNLKEYQMKKSSGDEWVRVDSKLEMELDEPKYELDFRAVNLANVAGPQHRIIIDSK